MFNKGYTTDAISRAGAAYPCGETEFHPCFKWRYWWATFNVLDYCMYILQSTASDYLFLSSNLFSYWTSLAKIVLSKSRPHTISTALLLSRSLLLVSITRVVV